MNRRPRTRTGIFRSFAKSTRSPAKGSTPIRSSFDVASRIMATRSSWLNTTPFSTRSATATVRWSNMRSARCIRSRCPFVTGSNVPANTARFMRLLFPRASRLPGAIERDRGLGVRAFGGDLDRPAPLDKPRLARAAAQRLDPERAGPGVEVEHPRVRDATRTQHVEDRFAGAVRRRTDAAGGDLDPPPAQLAAYDTDESHRSPDRSTSAAIRSATSSGVRPEVSTVAPAASAYAGPRRSRSERSRSST